MNLREQFPALALGWAVVFSALAAQATPAREQNNWQWADEHRQIAAESGARITGQWSTSTAPYLRRPMEVAGVDHPAASCWVCFAAKTGKTQIAVNALMHCIDTAPRSAMVVCPKADKVRDFDNKTWQPSVDATPKVAIKILAAKSRSGKGSIGRFKRFRGGFLSLANAGVESELQSDDIGLLIFEEPSSYPADAGGRGPPIRQARSRSDAWGDDAKEIGTGTPKFVGDCVVTAEVIARTNEQYYLPCPHCDAKQLLVWENMTRSEGRPYFICQGQDCGALIGHEEKRWMLDQADAGNGGYLARFEKLLSDGSPDPETDNPPPPPVIAAEAWAGWVALRGPEGSRLDGREPSFNAVWQAYSPFTTWARIFEKFDEASASGDPDDLVVFWQQVLGRAFEAAYDKPATKSLFDNREAAGRLAQLERGQIPPWAWALFGSCDVQGDRLEWAVWAVGPGGDGPDGAKSRRAARIDVGIIPIPPVDPRAWTELGQITQRKYEGPACRPIGFDRFGVDTGGHHTNRAYVFCAGRPNVMALKGASGVKSREALPIEAGTRRKAKVGRRVVAEVQLYLVGTHKVKKEVYYGLAQTLAGVEVGEHLPGSVTLEPTATENDFDQITAEVLLPKDKAKGRADETWEPLKGKRNEQLDLAVYALALAWSYLPDAMTQADWAALSAARRRDPQTAGELPLEAKWSGSVETAPPQPVADPVKPAAHAVRGPEAEHPLLRLARLNRGDDA